MTRRVKPLQTDAAGTGGSATKGSGQAKEERLLAELVRGLSITSAAEHAGMSRSTATRLMRDPEFRQRLAELRSLALAQNADLLGALSQSMALVLAEVARDKESPPGARVQAADAVLRHRKSLAEAAYFDERLAAVEQALAAQQRMRVAR